MSFRDAAPASGLGRNGGSSAALDRVFPCLFFAIAFVVAWTSCVDMPLLSDNQHYFFIAERAAAGVPPHVSHFDPKHALSMLISAAAISLGREVGVDDLIAARLVSIAAAAGSIALVWLVTRRLTRDVLAAHLAAVAMLSFHRFVLMAAMGARPKVFLVFFIVLALYLIASGRALTAGCAAAAAFLCWQPALVLVAAGPPVLLLRREGARSAAVFLAGAIVAVAAYEAYFVWHGALAEQLEQSYRFPALYMSGYPRSWAPVLRKLSWIFALQAGPSLKSLVPLLFAGGTLVLAVGAARRPAAARRLCREQPAIPYAVVCGAAALAFLLTNYQGFPDRFFLEPFMAIAAGSGLAAACAPLQGAAAARARSVLQACAVAATVALIAGGAYEFRAESGLQRQRDRAHRVAVEFLDRGLGVYAVGCTHLLALNHVDNYSKFGFFFRGVAEYLRDRPGEGAFMPVRNGSLPDVVLISRGKYLRTRPWFGQHYARDPEIRLGESIDVFRIRAQPLGQSR